MKNTIFIIAFIICFKPAFPFLEYVFNYEYIANVLCVNKEKVELNCNGKCYLMSKLAAESKEADKSEKRIPLEFTFSLLFLNKFQDYDTLFLNRDSFLINIFFKENKYKFNYFSELIKPPIL